MGQVSVLRDDSDAIPTGDGAIHVVALLLRLDNLAIRYVV